MVRQAHHERDLISAHHERGVGGRSINFRPFNGARPVFAMSSSATSSGSAVSSSATSSGSAVVNTSSVSHSVRPELVEGFERFVYI